MLAIGRGRRRRAAAAAASSPGGPSHREPRVPRYTVRGRLPKHWPWRGPARRTPGHSGRTHRSKWLIRHTDRWSEQPSPSLPIVQLAVTASMADPRAVACDRLRRTIDPAPTRKDLARRRGKRMGMSRAPGKYESRRSTNRLAVRAEAGFIVKSYDAGSAPVRPLGTGLPGTPRDRRKAPPPLPAEGAR
jgi:hypothetical protein